MDRRQFLATAAVGGAATLGIAYPREAPAAPAAAFPDRSSSWDEIKRRGTGLVWATEDSWRFVEPTIPTFDPMWRPPPLERMALAALHTPGGFHSFEHRWALAEAFRFHSGIGKDRVARRIHELNSLAKTGMAKLAKVRIHTPMSADLSAGIIAFEVAGRTPAEVVQRLHRQGIITSVTPGFYRPALARVAPSLLTTEADVERTVRAIAAL